MPAASGNRIEFSSAVVTSTAQSVSGQVATAAQPGAVPMPGGGSVIDAAAAGVASAAAENVAQASASLAPEPIEGVQKAENAVIEFEGQDAESAADIKSVAERMTPLPPTGGGSVGGVPTQMVGTASKLAGGDPSFD